MTNLELWRWMSNYKYPGFFRKIGDLLNPNTRICEFCGMRVSDVEVPVHITSKGGTFVHPIHLESILTLPKDTYPTLNK